MHCVSNTEIVIKIGINFVSFSQTIGEHEQRAVIDPQSISDPEVVKLQRILIDWINDELAEQRIIVQQLDEDMYDGQVLHKLWEKLTGKKLDVPEVTQSEQGQHEKLNIVLKAVNHVSNMKQKEIISNDVSPIRPWDSIKRSPNGQWPACTRKILWLFCIYWSLWCVTSARRCGCRRMSMSQWSLQRKTPVS